MSKKAEVVSAGSRDLMIVLSDPLTSCNRLGVAGVHKAIVQLVQARAGNALVLGAALEWMAEAGRFQEIDGCEDFGEYVEGLMVTDGSGTCVGFSEGYSRSLRAAWRMVLALDVAPAEVASLGIGKLRDLTAAWNEGALTPENVGDIVDQLRPLPVRAAQGVIKELRMRSRALPGPQEDDVDEKAESVENGKTLPDRLTVRVTAVYEFRLQYVRESDGAYSIHADGLETAAQNPDAYALAERFGAAALAEVSRRVKAGQPLPMPNIEEITSKVR